MKVFVLTGISFREQTGVSTAERNYPNSVVTDALERVHNISRETALKPSESKSEDRIPLTITYPNNLRVKDIILKNFKLLQSDPDAL